MEQIGKVFRQLRESRNISLRQATGGQFSPSMLSRFETGQSELSVEKFLFALENISASVEEILFLARGFQYDTDSELRKEITDVLEPKNIAPLEDLYRREYQKHAHSHNKQKHILNAIIIKSYMKSIDERVDLTAEEGKVLHDYLFSTEIWGIYELNLFSVSSPFLSVSLFTRYVREMVRKSDFLMEMSGNRNLFHTILLNGFLASIECEEFTNAYYFKRVIEEHFYKGNETYFRIVYLWAEGLLDSKQGRVKEGQKRWRMLSVFLRCLAVINLPNTIEIRPNVEYLQTKKKFEAIELLPSLRSLQKFYRFFAHFICCIYSKESFRKFISAILKLFLM